MDDINNPNNNPNPNIIDSGNTGFQTQTNVLDRNRQRGTGFSNINRVLGANVGAGGQLAGRIGGAIQGQGQRVRQNLGQAQEQFQTGFQKARQESLGNIGAVTSLVKQPGESDADYEKRIASGGGDFAQLGQNLMNTSYQGPTGFTNPNMLLSQAQNVGQLGTFARTGTGQGMLARQFATGRGNYTMGQNFLDQMFLTQDPNAQRQIQQARQSVAGLGQAVQSAATGAEQAAKATAAGVEQEKAKAQTDIQQAAQGILGRGASESELFNKKMDRMKNILTNLASGKPDMKLNDEDLQLISDMEKYGLNNTLLYSGRNNANEAEINNVIANLASSMVKQPGGTMKLTEDQKQAAINLARLQGNAALEQKVIENKFDPIAFKGDPNTIANKLNENYARDKETRDVLQRAGEFMKKQEDIYTAKNQQQRDLAINSLPSEEELDKKYGAGNGKIYRDMAIEQINQGYESAQKQLTEGVQPDWSKFADIIMGRAQAPQPTQQQKILSNIMENIPGQQYTTEFDQDYGAGRDIIGGLKEALGPYAGGWLAYGDRSPDIASGFGANEGNIDPRFAGLGLGLTAGRGSGGLRTSRDFLNAASKAMGEQTSLRDLILQRMSRG